MEAVLQVLRVENEIGAGPYQGDMQAYSLCMSIFDDVRQPGPFDDPGIREAWKQSDRTSFVFGFRDYNQFRMWFSSEAVLDQLRGLGYGLTCYTVPVEDVVIGSTQAIFRKDRANTFWSSPSFVPPQEGSPWLGLD